MTIASSGAISFSDLRAEFVGGSSAISFSDLYRGGSNVRAKASNNFATNLAAAVPTSGAISVQNFLGTAKAFRITYGTGAAAANYQNQNAATLFGDDYAVNYPKEIVIGSGVELGATSPSDEALELPAGGAGLITITNNGTMSGAGGTAGGGTGGDAFESSVNCTIINNGIIRAGGGGGGAGGNGGNGTYSSVGYGYNASTRFWQYNCGNIQVQYGPGGYNVGYFTFQGYWWQTSYGSYYRGTIQSGTLYECYGTSKFQLGITSTYNTTGGSGGAGGKGQGYISAAASGSAGANGSGQNAGAGGTGGTGGDYGAAGGTGNTGVNGNSTNGAAGGAGGAAGKYARESAGTLTFTNNGTVLGNAP